MTYSSFLPHFLWTLLFHQEKKGPLFVNLSHWDLINRYCNIFAAICSIESFTLWVCRPPPVNLLCASSCFEWQSCAPALRLNLTGGLAWEKRRDFGPLLLSFMEWRLLRLMSALISINFSLFPIKPATQREHEPIFTWPRMKQHLSGHQYKQLKLPHCKLMLF